MAAYSCPGSNSRIRSIAAGGVFGAHAPTAGRGTVTAVRAPVCHSEYPRLTARLRVLCGQRRAAAAIAAELNAEGFHPPKRATRFTRAMVLRLIGQLGLGCREPHGSATGLGPNEYRPAGLAGRLAIHRNTVRRWSRVGWVHVRRDGDGHHVIWADAGELRRLRELRQLPRDWANRARLAQLIKPGPRPVL